MARELGSDTASRIRVMKLVQHKYKDFTLFLYDVMTLLGYPLSEIQINIALFLVEGGRNIMVQAQRGQAKTTIAAAFCVWSLIHNPQHRITVFSASSETASDISILIIRVIMAMPILEYMRPDVRNGDRSSVKHFDVHYALKGVEKSPSVKSLGIESTIQGNRSTILLADDVESSKNSMTPVMRAQLAEITLEFSSLCTTGRIIWLGTPQSQDSIYNALPGRGVHLRIWPGRYPTIEEEEVYGDHLAPLIVARMQADPSLRVGGGMLGDRGKPIEKEGTGWLDEANQVEKEEDQGVMRYNLQYMLNTRLSDSMRHPLKPESCILLDVKDKGPLEVIRSMDIRQCTPFTSNGFGFKIRLPQSTSPETKDWEIKVAYVDPAGGGLNADETAYVVLGLLNGNIYILEVGGLPGGYDILVLNNLAERIGKHKPHKLLIEKNMGHGAFREVWLPIFKQRHACAVDDDNVTTQKEVRIIKTLEPVIGRGSLIVTPHAIEQDRADCSVYAPRFRQEYSLFYQMSKITIDRGALLHDDRLDALEGGVRELQKYLAIDQRAALEKARVKEKLDYYNDPLGIIKKGRPSRQGGSILTKYRRF